MYYFIINLDLERKCSTVYALLQIKEMIFIDLRKAFYAVNHEILLIKLEHYSIRGNMLNWFQSYLSNRKRYVSFNGHPSELLEINCGVPKDQS